MTVLVGMLGAIMVLATQAVVRWARRRAARDIAKIRQRPCSRVGSEEELKRVEYRDGTVDWVPCNDCHGCDAQ
jgi:hypothetical protein